MAEQLTIEAQQLTPEHKVLKLTGTLVLNTVFQFQNTVRADESPALTLDMSGVKYLDSAGIGALVNAHVSHTKNGRTFSLAGVNDRVMEVMKITRVNVLFTFEDQNQSPAASQA